MAAIQNLSDLINRGTGGNSGTPEIINVFKAGRVAGAAAVTQAGFQSSLFLYDGSPSHGAAPGAVRIPDATTNGGLKQTNPGGGRTKWLVYANFASRVAGTLIIYDRLLDISGLDGTNLGAQAVGGAITRYTDGVGNFAFAEIYTQLGGTQTTFTLAYTDQGGAASTTQAQQIGNTNYREVQRAITAPLQVGDTGIQGVTSVTLAGSTTTAGNFGITIGHPLVVIPCPGAGYATPVNAIDQTVEVKTGACLALLWLASVSTPPDLYGQVGFIEA
jgi:hypothetical protein